MQPCGGAASLLRQAQRTAPAYKSIYAALRHYLEAARPQHPEV
eukprot:CAMPEP_0119315036 /NCGR_PEP_ID=MMETSP1333-20130426/34242_1 /TAXON_ID=418940 /ORGANISM="Scyphosphaera apsteinii, Strain RCC1455" /LENGTH=42 /DNA_ID= /DNA_START= /DNA_END= /DNA_ORIENTATION=